MRLLLAALALSAAAGAAVACSSATTGCDCSDPAITISIPADVAPSVSAVHVTGPACDGAVVTCANQAGGCSQYRFTAKAAGVCDVEVDFSSGKVFQAQVTVTGSTQACCPGFYASPASAAQISVPTPDGG